MALAISIDRTFHRNDSTIFPKVTIDDYTETPYIKLADWQYFQAPSDEFSLQPNNRSLVECPVRLRDCFLDIGNWELPPSSPGHIFALDLDGTMTRSGGTTGWEGFYYTIPLEGNVISIQAKAITIDHSAGISLQDFHDPVRHNYFTDTEIKHAIIFGLNGQLTIREATVKPKSVAGDFEYEIGDTAIIELDGINNIVRYYLVKTDGRMILLRTTRSKLTTDPTAEAMLYSDGSSLGQVLLHSGSEATATFENIGVARRKKGVKEWQKWGNQRARVSSGVPIQLADGEFAYTFPSSKRVLRQPSLTPKTFNDEGFQDFEDFFDWHGNEKNFIFVDEARKDILGNPQTYWARFGSPMTDTTKNLCLFDYGVALIEAHRRDYIPQVVDETPPEITLAENSGFAPDQIAVFIATATDDQAIDFVRFYIDGRHIFNLDVTSTTDEFQIAFSTNGIDPGTYDITAVAHDIAGNTAVSNTQPLIVT